MNDALLIRPGTSDVRNFRDIYIEECYRLEMERPPKTILDLGAYIGLASRWLGDRYPKADVIAVEPNPNVVPLLRHNAPSAEIHGVAVGAQSGRSDLHLDGVQEWRASTERPGTGGSCSVEVATVDDVLQGRTAEMVKVDVEGAERGVFKEGGEWLGGVRTILLETHDRFVTGCFDAVRQGLDATGRPWRYTRRSGEDLVIRLQ